MNLLLSLVVPLLLANQLTGVFQRMFCSPFMILWIYGFRSSYSWIGTAFLNSRIEKVLEKSYFRPNSVYCPEVTKSCRISRWTSIGLFIHSSIRPRRNLASLDMAGLNNFIPGKVTNHGDMAKKIGHPPAVAGSPGRRSEEHTSELQS